MLVEYQHLNAAGGGSTHSTLEAAQGAMRKWEERARLQPDLPKSLGIFVREVSEWRRVSE